WENGDESVHEAMRGFAAITDRFRDALEAGDRSLMDTIINENFDLRRSIMNLNPGHVAMVEAARSAGASAKYTGSGGAIIGTYEDAAGYERLTKALGELGATVIRPEVG
ncbi:MAG TPA: GHMP kinase, partial [Spirochaetia bacterium]|nr:GHMP kinase [Spirochaetia bacterium]